MTKYIKGIIQSVDKETGTFEVLASTSDVDRDGEIIEAKGWNIKNFLKNPVILWAHNYNELPIGVAESVGIEDGLKIKGRFASEKANPKAQQVRRLVDEGIQKAVSVGLIPEERDPNNDKIITRAELLEVSFVPVPANPNALAMAAGKGFSLDMFKFPKGAVALHTTPKANVDMAWDGDKATNALRAWAGGPDKDDIDFKKYSTGFAWFDSAEADNFTAYKMPHHDVEGGSMVVVFRGVVAAMGVLLGARGGVDIPEGDRRKVYNHLVKHYKQFNKDAPEFRSYNPEELKVLFGKAEHDSPICDPQSPQYDPEKCAADRGKDRHTHPECDPLSDKFDQDKCDELSKDEKQAREVQTLILSKDRFSTEDQAIKWVRDHDFRADKIDATENSFRFRQFNPGLCKDDTQRTIEITKGVQGVVCAKKKAKIKTKTDDKDFIIIEVEESQGGEPKTSKRTREEVRGQGQSSESNVVVELSQVQELREATLKAYRHNELVLSLTKRILAQK